MFRRQRDGVLRDDRLPRRGVRGHEDGVAHLEMIHRLLLERIKLERILQKEGHSQERGHVSPRDEPYAPSPARARGSWSSPCSHRLHEPNPVSGHSHGVTVCEQRSQDSSGSAVEIISVPRLTHDRVFESMVRTLVGSNSSISAVPLPSGTSSSSKDPYAVCPFYSPWSADVEVRR